MAKASPLVVRSMGRSREGAWIEMHFQPYFACIYRSRSREGAWIEIDVRKVSALTAG